MAYNLKQWRAAIADAQSKLQDASILIDAWDRGTANPTGISEGDSRFQFPLSAAQKQAIYSAFVSDINAIISGLQAGL